MTFVDSIFPFTGLLRGDTLLSKDKACQLLLDSSGQLKLMFGTELLWSPNPKDAASGLFLQGNGDLVLWGPKGAVWRSEITGGEDVRLAMQCDGNLVIYAGSKPRWATNTSKPLAKPSERPAWLPGGQPPTSILRW